MFYPNASGPLPLDRDQLGRNVREAWVRWAEMQPNSKPSWLVPYDELNEADKEADRQIGEHVCRLTMLAIASANGSPMNDIEPARIVMDGEPDRVAELEAQVRALREACEEAQLFIGAHEEADTFIVGDHVRAALAATAPKEAAK